MPKKRIVKHRRPGRPRKHYPKRTGGARRRVARPRIHRRKVGGARRVRHVIRRRPVMRRGRGIRRPALGLARIGGMRRRLRGKGFFGNLWNGIKKAATWVNDKLKETKVISKVAPMLSPVGQHVGAIAGAAGYGRKRYIRKVKAPKRKIVRIPRGVYLTSPFVPKPFGLRYANKQRI